MGLLQAILAAIAEHSASSEWASNFVPFARDIDGTLLGLVYHEGGKTEEGEEASPHDVTVAEWSADDGIDHLSKQTPATYLEAFRDRLLSHKFEYIPDVGLVERVGAAISPKKSKK